MFTKNSHIRNFKHRSSEDKKMF
uniref:Uncharacterized protein n=1 Tax=Rhizophora mucronata TaxID=61149 RepID=A0A2P2PY65_RHIMU